MGGNASRKRMEARIDELEKHRRAYEQQRAQLERAAERADKFSMELREARRQQERIGEEARQAAAVANARAEAARQAAAAAARENAAISLRLQQEQALRAEQARALAQELEAARADAERRIAEELAREHQRKVQRWQALNREYPVPDHLRHYVNAVSEEIDTERQAKRFVNIGVLGNSGIGKSSLIKCILEKFESASRDDIRPSTSFEGDGTCKPSPYLLGEPLNEHEVYIWDLPGQGTSMCPSKTYLCDMGLKYFDAILVVTAERWTENDTSLLTAIRFAGIWCCVVRTKIDLAVEAAEHDHNLSQEDALQEVRRKLKEQLPDLEEEKLYLVTSRKKHWVGGETGASGYGSIQMLCDHIQRVLEGEPDSGIASLHHGEAMDQADISDDNLSDCTQPWEVTIITDA